MSYEAIYRVPLFSKHSTLWTGCNCLTNLFSFCSDIYFEILVSAYSQRLCRHGMFAFGNPQVSDVKLLLLDLWTHLNTYFRLTTARHSVCVVISYYYLCNSKYYSHMYNFFRWANPLRGGLGLGTWDICRSNWTSRKASAIWGPQMLRVPRPYPPSIWFAHMKKL